MMRSACLFVAFVSLSLGLAVYAQPVQILYPDDFVDPREHLNSGAIFISRLGVGAASGDVDQYLPGGQELAFVYVANSFYWGPLQIDFKFSDARGEDPLPEDDPPCHEIASAQASLCTEARPDDDAQSVPGAKSVLQVAWYQTIGPRVTIRYRLAQARQYALPETAAHVPGLKDHDDTRMAQIDAGVRVHGRTLSGYAGYAELTRFSTLDRTKQRSLTLGAFLPLVSVGPAILTPRLQIAGIAGIGPAIDVVNPSLDLSWTIPRAETNLHVIYSPVYGDLGAGTKWKHHVVVSADRALAFRFGHRGHQ